MYPHRIRLRGPWECEPIGASAPAERRVTMPSGWVAAGLEGFRGQARFMRRFGYPGRIDAGEHVWLIGADARGCRAVTLNNHMLKPAGEVLRPGVGGLPSFAFDVTAILAQRNLLEIVVQGDTDDAGLWGEIALEIRRDAYLADVAVERRGATVRVTGSAVGVALQPLELYTLVDNRHADYRTIDPSPGGTPFAIDLADVPSAKSLRVELIRVSSIWYAVELPIPQWHPA
jgi:hypothetical protein